MAFSTESWIANHQIIELPAGSHRVQQINHLVEKTGVDRPQAETLLRKSFEKDFEVTVGGSRVRGNVRPNSDLDIGYRKIKPGVDLHTVNNQVGKINKAVEKAGITPIEQTKIFPGNETSQIPKINSSEEFFQRSGYRTEPGRMGETFKPSGSYTYKPDGSVIYIPPRPGHEGFNGGIRIDEMYT
jgi:predicted nucleotidyltransferase